VGFVNTDRIFREANSRQGGAGQAGTGIRQAREGPQRPGHLAQDGLRQVRARGAHPVRKPARQRQKGLIDQDREFQRKRREFQEDLNARKNEELQTVLDRANRVVKQVAEQEKYDLILQEASTSTPSTTSPTR
jgi:outer membrane protein